MRNDIEAAAREAFVSHMASVGVIYVVWTSVGTFGCRDNHNVLLSVEWERFDAGYRAALALAGAAPDAASRPAPRIPADAGDAGAMRERAARLLDDEVERLKAAAEKVRSEGGRYVLQHYATRFASKAAAIRALHLPAAPASGAVEEAARAAVVRFAVEARNHGTFPVNECGVIDQTSAVYQSYIATLADLWRSVDALTAALRGANGGE